MGWRDIVGDAGRIVGIDHFGASADYQRLYHGVRPHRRGRRPGSQGQHRRRRRQRADRPADSPTPDTPHERTQPMNDRLQALSDQGVSIWLDDISRERLTSGNLAELIEDSARRRRDLQPDDLRQGALRRRRLRRAGQGPRRPRRRPRGGGPGDHDVRRPLGAATCCATSTTAPTGRTAGSASRSTRGWRTDTDATIAEARALWWLVDRSNVMIKIPATQEGLRRHHRRHRRGHQRQRHADLQPRPLPGRDGRLPHRARAGALARASTCRRSARSRRSSSAGSTPRSTSGSTRSGAATRRRPCAARPRSPTPGSPTRRTRRSSAPTAGRRSRAAGAHQQRPLWASTVGQGPRPSRHDVRRRPGRAATPSTRCRRRPSRRPPTTARSPATQVTTNYDDAAAGPRRLEKLGISYDDVVQVVEDEGVDKFEKSWQELLDTVHGGTGGGTRSEDADAHRHAPRRRTTTPSRRWSPTGWRAGSPPRTPRSGARTPSPRRRSGSSLGRPAHRRRGRCSPRSTPCGPSCGPRASTGSCSAAWAARRWRRR